MKTIRDSALFISSCQPSLIVFHSAVSYPAFRSPRYSSGLAHENVFVHLPYVLCCIIIFVSLFKFSRYLNFAILRLALRFLSGLTSVRYLELSNAQLLCHATPPVCP